MYKCFIDGSGQLITYQPFSYYRLENCETERLCKRIHTYNMCLLLVSYIVTNYHRYTSQGTYIDFDNCETGKLLNKFMYHHRYTGITLYENTYPTSGLVCIYGIDASCTTGYN